MLDAKTHRVKRVGRMQSGDGRMEGNGDHITFGQMASTMMADGMDAEQRFLKAMGSVSQWKIAGRRLELMDDSGGVVAEFEAK